MTEDTKLIVSLLETIKSSIDDYIKSLDIKLYSVVQNKNNDKHIKQLEENINKQLIECLNKINELAKNIVKTTDEKQQMETLLNNYKSELSDLAKSYYLAKENFIQKQKRLLQKEYLIVHPETSKQELETIKWTDQVLMLDPSFLEAKEQYRHIIERNKQIHELENELNYLQQLFVNCKILIENQASIIINVEENVDTAVKYVEQGNINLKETNKISRKIRKKYLVVATCCVIILVIAIALIIKFVKI